MGTAIDCHDRTRVMVQFRASIVIPEVVISPTGMEENFVIGMAPWGRSAVGKPFGSPSSPAPLIPPPYPYSYHMSSTICRYLQLR
ncbi:expressed protein [Echinococcus multilocularis]|uniref:Expressed protein n=1 Tax=Echinococcus multilocularis TaxID=6211 RepID=A0A087W256_ECHMU|nr:expressed protein [Echinococcus multilocularis]